MRCFGLLGFPLTHSFSQKYFTKKFEELKLRDCEYENFSIQNIEEFSEILQNRQDLRGFNITIPYKKQVLPFLDENSDVVTEIGACNCVNIINGRLIGHNTDAIAFEQSLHPFLQPHHRNALVLGTGGASAAIAFVLKKLGIQVQFVSRTPSETAISYENLNEVILSSYLLIINTTPVGMYPNVEDFPKLPYQFISAQHHFYDLTYNPIETKFLEKGRLRGATTQNGQDMLVLQAEESWRIWNS